MANTKCNVKIEIDKSLCKGCRICVHYCPKDVLEIGDDRKVAVKNIEACIGCGLCEINCPDYAIFVIREKEEG